jgi:hypothetical protein
VQPVPAEPQRKVPWLPVALGVLAVVLLLAVCLGAAGLAVVKVTRFAHHVRQSVGQAVDQAIQGLQPLTTVMVFQASLSAGDTKGAYDLTTERFRQGRTREDFARLVNEHPELAGAWIDVAAEDQTETTLTIRVTAEAQGGKKVPVKLRLRKENDQWKVDDLILP